MAFFVDTNVLLYAVSTATGEAAKAATARAILDRDDLVLSTQVLQEFYVQATRSTRADRLAHESAANLIESWLRFRVVETTVSLVQQALANAARWRSRTGMPPSSRQRATVAARSCSRRTCSRA